MKCNFTKTLVRQSWVFSFKKSFYIFKSKIPEKMVKEHKKEIRKTEVQMLKIMKRLSSPLISKETQNYSILFFRLANHLVTHRITKDTGKSRLPFFVIGEQKHSLYEGHSNGTTEILNAHSFCPVNSASRNLCSCCNYSYKIFPTKQKQPTPPKKCTFKPQRLGENIYR